MPAGLDDLDAQVVLLVDHDRAGLVTADDGRPALAGGEFLRDQVTFDEHRAVAVAQFAHAQHVSATELRQRVEGLDAAVGDLLALRHLGPARERHAVEVAGEADARAEHDRLLRAEEVRQFVFGGEDVFDGGHVQRGASCFSISAISSRRRAAAS